MVRTREEKSALTKFETELLEWLKKQGPASQIFQFKLLQVIQLLARKIERLERGT